MLQQAYDFCDESNAIYELLSNIDDDQFNKSTLFKGWTFNNVIGHLHVWNYAADISLKDGEEWKEFSNNVLKAFGGGSTFSQFEETIIKDAKGKELLNIWKDYYSDMTERFAIADPKKRVKWGGPEMSARSKITARHMETWAHGQEVFDALGKDREEKDIIKNIVHMGVIAYGWTFVNRKLAIPEPTPYLILNAPSGEVWQWNDKESSSKIEGTGVEFAQVVTQVRNFADTKLSITGEPAIEWMKYAQCFAGPPEDPPAKGTRYKVGN